MKLLSHFNTFLKDVVNLNDSRLEVLEGHIEAVDSYLAASSEIGDRFVATIPQGSYAHRTIIKPLPDREFDADILLKLDYVSEWAARDYIEETYREFRRSGIYKDRVTRKSRCVRVQYAGDHHLDVVPAVEIGGAVYITNRNEGESGEFERTDPEGYSSWFEDKNQIAGGHLVRVIRLLKWLRDYKGTFTCRSAILNILVGQRIEEWRTDVDAGYYADVPTTLVHVLEDLASFLRPFDRSRPSVADPACPEVTFDHRWTDDQFFNFRQKVIDYSEKASAAYGETDRDSSIRKWRELFGDDFAKSATLSKAMGAVDDPEPERDPGEELIEDRFPVQLTGTVKLKALVEAKPGFRAYSLTASRGAQVATGRSLRFELGRCTVPEPFKVYWKVKNRGAQAAELNNLRGQIVAGGHVWTERTAFRGPHYVECYIVKDGVCVARAHQPVVIVNRMGSPQGY